MHDGPSQVMVKCSALSMVHDRRDHTMNENGKASLSQADVEHVRASNTPEKLIKQQEVLKQQNLDAAGRNQRAIFLLLLMRLKVLMLNQNLR